MCIAARARLFHRLFVPNGFPADSFQKKTAELRQLSARQYRNGIFYHFAGIQTICRLSPR